MEFKPCPFCGSSRIEYDRSGDCAPDQVTCRGCGANLNGKNEADAVANWNHRVEPVEDLQQ